MKHYKSVEFLLNLNVKHSLHKRKAPPHKCNAPLLMTFLETILSYDDGRTRYSNKSTFLEHLLMGKG